MGGGGGGVGGVRAVGAAGALGAAAGGCPPLFCGPPRLACRGRPHGGGTASPIGPVARVRGGVHAGHGELGPRRRTPMAWGGHPFFPAGPCFPSFFLPFARPTCRPADPLPHPACRRGNSAAPPPGWQPAARRRSRPAPSRVSDIALSVGGAGRAPAWATALLRGHPKERLRKRGVPTLLLPACPPSPPRRPGRWCTAGLPGMGRQFPGAPPLWGRSPVTLPSCRLSSSRPRVLYGTSPTKGPVPPARAQPVPTRRHFLPTLWDSPLGQLPGSSDCSQCRVPRAHAMKE